MKILNLIIAFLICNNANAQNTIGRNGTPTNQKYGLIVAYNGYKISNAGFKIGVEKYLASTTSFKIVSSLALKLDRATNDFSALGLQATIGQRFTNNFGLMLETHVGIGVQRSVYTSTIYNVSATPITKSYATKSQINANPNIAFGVGFDMSKKTKYPVLVFARPTINWIFPNQHAVFANYVALELGVVYRLKR
jgi:hypothetical protein